VSREYLIDDDDGDGDDGMEAERRRRRDVLAGRLRRLPAGLIPLVVEPDGEITFDPRIDRAIVAAISHAQAADLTGEFGFPEGEEMIVKAVRTFTEALVDLALVCTGLMAPEVGPEGPDWYYRPDGDPRGRRANYILDKIREVAHEPR
jgi:hypothetical protein